MKIAILAVIILGMLLTTTQAFGRGTQWGDYKKVFGPYNTLEEAEAVALSYVLTDSDVVHATVRPQHVSWECEDCHHYMVEVWYRN